MRSIGGGREHGFTLPELLIAVVLLGLVVGPLSVALVQALTVLPSSQERSDVATQRRLLVDRLSDDIANATSVEVLGPNLVFFGVETAWKLRVCREGPDEEDEVIRLSWFDGGSRETTYSWEYGEAVNGMVPVTMARTSAAGTHRFEVGYCALDRGDGTADAVSVVRYEPAGAGDNGCPVTAHARVCASLKVADRPDGTPVWYRMGGTRRTPDTTTTTTAAG